MFRHLGCSCLAVAHPSEPRDCLKEAYEAAINACLIESASFMRFGLANSFIPTLIRYSMSTRRCHLRNDRLVFQKKSGTLAAGTKSRLPSAECMDP